MDLIIAIPLTLLALFGELVSAVGFWGWVIIALITFAHVAND